MKRILVLLFMVLLLVPSFAFAEPTEPPPEEPTVIDTDGDGIPDSEDIYPDDATNTPPDENKPIVSSSLAEGTYTSNQQVTLSVNEDAIIYYTVNGDTPNNSSSVYVNPILIDETRDLKFYAVDTAGNESEIVTLKYVINPLSDRDGDGISDAEDVYPDDATNTPPAYDETSEAEDNKKTQSLIIMLVGLGMTALVLGGKGIL